MVLTNASRRVLNRLITMRTCRADAAASALHWRYPLTTVLPSTNLSTSLNTGTHSSGPFIHAGGTCVLVKTYTHWRLQHFLSITEASEPTRLSRAFISVENLVDSRDELAVEFLNAGTTRTSDTDAIQQVVKMLDMHPFLVTATPAA